MTTETRCVVRGVRLSVDSYVNEKALARVLRAFRDVS